MIKRCKARSKFESQRCEKEKNHEGSHVGLLHKSGVRLVWDDKNEIIFHKGALGYDWNRGD